MAPEPFRRLFYWLESGIGEGAGAVTLAFRGTITLLCELFVEDDAEKGAVHLQPTVQSGVIMDESEFAKFVHEEIDA